MPKYVGYTKQPIICWYFHRQSFANSLKIIWLTWFPFCQSANLC